MAGVYIEARPQGSRQGDPIDDFIVETVEDLPLAVFGTLEEASQWAKGQGYAPHVARERHLNDKRNPDHWRAI